MSIILFSNVFSVYDIPTGEIKSNNDDIEILKNNDNNNDSCPTAPTGEANKGINKILNNSTLCTLFKTENGWISWIIYFSLIIILNSMIQDYLPKNLPDRSKKFVSFIVSFLGVTGFTIILVTNGILPDLFMYWITELIILGLIGNFIFESFKDKKSKSVGKIVVVLIALLIIESWHQLLMESLRVQNGLLYDLAEVLLPGDWNVWALLLVFPFLYVIFNDDDGEKGGKKGKRGKLFDKKERLNEIKSRLKFIDSNFHPDEHMDAIDTIEKRYNEFIELKNDYEKNFKYETFSKADNTKKEIEDLIEDIEDLIDSYHPDVKEHLFELPGGTRGNSGSSGNSRNKGNFDKKDINELIANASKFKTDDKNDIAFFKEEIEKLYDKYFSTTTPNSEQKIDAGNWVSNYLLVETVIKKLEQAFFKDDFKTLLLIFKDKSNFDSKKL